MGVVATVGLIIFAIASVICGSSGDVDSDSNRVGGRIVGGFEVDIQDHPYMAALLDNDEQFCGATILTPWWLLTAAHCVTDRIRYRWFPKDVTNLSVLVGSSYIEPADDSLQRMRVSGFVIHASYDLRKALNDIALIELTEPMDLSGPFASSVNLTTTNNSEVDPKPDEECVALGWGETEPQPRTAFSPVLLMVDLDLIPIHKCMEKHRRSAGTIRERTNLCTSTVGERDTCAGDSGGPLICDGQQWAVTSWGKGCAVKDTPGVWTRVDYYLDWIQKVTSRTGHRPSRSFKYIDNHGGSLRTDSDHDEHTNNSNELGVHFLSVFFASLLFGMMYGN